MTVRRLLLLLLLPLLLLPAPALSAEDVIIYTIKKGDTLWGISQKFLKDPYYWPNLWANNPDLTNPHFIEPGQQLRIYDGRIEIVPAKPGAEPTAVAETTTEAAPTPEAAAIPQSTAASAAESSETTLKAPAGVGFISMEQLDGIGTVVDTVDNRILISERDKVFLQMKQPVGVGEKFTLFELADPVIHPATGQPFGYRVRDLGMVEVTEIGTQVATGIVRRSFREIRRGAKLIPYVVPTTEISLKQATQPIQGYLVDAYTPRATQGQNDIVFLDLGSADGLAVGNLVYISRSRQASERADKSLQLQLPDLLAGSAIVIEAREHTATALILKVTGPIYRGDRITAVTER